MPAPGFSTLTISTKTYEELVDFTKALEKRKGVPVSVPAAVEYLVKNCQNDHAEAE